MDNRALLTEGNVYRLHEENSFYKCIKVITDSAYSYYCAELQNVSSKWTFIARGTNQYDDGSIDWDFSTGGHFDESARRALARFERSC